jgi:bifunctional UDP-N-acetylglucosamine pyrophosphorylase/glucosamine-1-phosphate N-acetyltransferase
MDDIFCIILAAGMGKRMGSNRPKALTETRNGALIDLSLESLAPLQPKKTVIVAGHMREVLQEHLARSASARKHNLDVVIQEEQLGTGHAARCALPALEGAQGTVIITYADQPLFTPATLQHFIEVHRFRKATVSAISFMTPPPNGYGRIVRNERGDVVRITEAKDCNPEQLLIQEVNSGLYAVDSAFLKPALNDLSNNNAQGEYYLTDIVEKAVREGQRVTAFPLANAREAAGVNNPSDLAFVNDELARRHISQLIESGVRIVDPTSCFIDPTVVIEPGAVVGPNVQLRGTTSVASDATIEGTAVLINTIVSRGATVKIGVRSEDAVLGEGCMVGPFAHLRPGTKLGAEVKVGSFVETKNAVLADHAKAGHLIYLGDCTVGKDANIGAGTITCNYDGYRKFKTTIGDGVFIGSNSSLVAPVTVGSGALVAAGSVITKDVPEDALGLARARQEVRDGWARARREKLEREKTKG